MRRVFLSIALLGLAGCFGSAPPAQPELPAFRVQAYVRDAETDAPLTLAYAWRDTDAWDHRQVGSDGGRAWVMLHVPFQVCAESVSYDGPVCVDVTEAKDQDVVVRLRKREIVTPPAAEKQLPRITVAGTSFQAAGQRFRWRGVTAFRLAYQVATGRTSEAETFIRWAAEREVTVLRVLAMAYGMFSMSPEMGRMALPEVLELARQHGVYVEIVALADTASYYFDHATHVREVGALCAMHTACLGVEIANEPRHSTQNREVGDPDYLLTLAREVPSPALVALGAAHGGDDESLDFVGGDYVTVHADRAEGDRGWRWVRHAREIQALRDGSHGKPAVNDEPERSDLAPDKHLALAILMQMWDVGDTVHLASLRDGQIPTGDERAAFEARRQGWRLVDDFVGAYSRASLEGDPVAGFSDDDIVRLYSAISRDQALVLGLGVMSEASITWRDSWNRALLWSTGEMRLWRMTR